MAKHLYRVYALNEKNKDEVLIYDNLNLTQVYHLFDRQITKYTPMIIFHKKDEGDWTVHETHKREEIDKVIQEGAYKLLD